MSEGQHRIKNSIKMSYLLRHNPEDLKMDKEGWVSVSDLLEKLRISKVDLDFIVDNNNKKRFAYNSDGTKIRASQGHSAKLGLKIDFNEVQFPGIYYHGTDFLNKNSILKHGLRPGNRAYVHLSKDLETATKVGHRHGDTVIVFMVDGNQMRRDGYKIYESENGVILVKEVPPKYLKM
jgi:putative RNA 2'-phosphotransferase